jgi:hypothetical protein
MSYVLCPMSYVLYPMSYILCPISYVLCRMSYVLQYPIGRSNYCVKEVSSLTENLCGKTQYFGDVYSQVSLMLLCLNTAVTTVTFYPMSYWAKHWQYILYPISYVLCRMSYVVCPMSYVLCTMYQLQAKCEFRKCSDTCTEGAETFEFEGQSYSRERYCCKVSLNALLSLLSFSMPYPMTISSKPLTNFLCSYLLSPISYVLCQVGLLQLRGVYALALFLGATQCVCAGALSGCIVYSVLSVWHIRGGGASDCAASEASESHSMLYAVHLRLPASYICHMAYGIAYAIRSNTRTLQKREATVCVCVCVRLHDLMMLTQAIKFMLVCPMCVMSICELIITLSH